MILLCGPYVFIQRTAAAAGDVASLRCSSPLLSLQWLCRNGACECCLALGKERMVSVSPCLQPAEPRWRLVPPAAPAYLPTEGRSLHEPASGVQRRNQQQSAEVRLRELGLALSSVAWLGNGDRAYVSWCQDRCRKIFRTETQTSMPQDSNFCSRGGKSLLSDAGVLVSHPGATFCCVESLVMLFPRKYGFWGTRVVTTGFLQSF